MGVMDACAAYRLTFQGFADGYMISFYNACDLADQLFDRTASFFGRRAPSDRGSIWAMPRSSWRVFQSKAG
jgi:hypothetical protein